MSGVLHPVGPEPASTYWLRRALVIGTLAVVVAVMTALLGGRNGPQEAVSAVPASSAPAATPTAGPLDPTTSATSLAPTTSPSPAESSTTSPTPTRSEAAKKSEATKKAPEAKKSTTTKKAPDTKKAPETKKPTAQTSKAPQKAAPLCDPDVLRPTLTGKQSLKPKEDTTFTLSMINGGNATCAVSVNAENFELKIYSGKDRIWSTGDCSTAVKSIVRDVSSQQAVEWKMTWNGRRSADGCKNRAAIPQPGTYVATATLEGTKPVKLRMTLAD